MTDQRSFDPKCLVCGYSLVGLASHICPECGQVFDPENPRSYTNAMHWSPRIVRQMQPPPLWHVLAVSVVAVYGVFAASNPHGPMLHWLVESLHWLGVILGVGTVVAVDYLLRLGARETHELLPSPARPALQPRKWRWFVTPACALVLLSAIFTTWPLVVRFHLSRAAFEERVAELQSGNAPATPCRIGLYWVEDIEYSGQGDVFFSLPAKSYMRVGFHYAPLVDRYGTADEIAESWFAVWLDS